MIGLDLNPPWVEGIRNSVRLISKDLIKDQNEIFILTKGYDNQLDIEDIEGMKYHRISIGHSTCCTSGMFTFFLKLPFKLVKISRDEQIDIIHGHSVSPTLGIVLGMCSKVLGVKTAFTLYSSPFRKNESLSFPSRILMNALNPSRCTPIIFLLSFFTDKIIVTSDTARKSLIVMGIPENKIEFIQVGIDVTLFKPLKNTIEIKNKLQIPLDKKIILFAGDITPWKGLDTFLKSINLVIRKHTNILFIIMTKNIYRYESERREEINKNIELNELEKNIHIIGQYNSIQEIFGISDIVVFPFKTVISFFDTSILMDVPLSLLEAMAAGKPVIASDIGSFDEVIKNNQNGLLIQQNDEVELANAIMKLLENPSLYNNLADNVRSSMNETYDIKSTSLKIGKLYERMISRRNVL